jgi:TatD DNase family protein
MEAQRRLFNLHLAEAERLQKPVVLHVVKSFEEVMNILAKYNIESVVFHGFIGSTEQAMRAVNMGYYLSFGERSLRSPKSCRALEQIPIDRLFCETDDNPDICISEIYKKVANLRNIEIEELARQLVENYKRVIYKR